MPYLIESPSGEAVADRLQNYEASKEWIDFMLHSGKDLTMSEIEEGITWLYASMGISRPLIYISESYLQQKMKLAQMTEEERGASLAGRVRTSIAGKLENAINAATHNEPTFPLGHLPAERRLGDVALSEVKNEIVPVRTAIMADASFHLDQAWLAFVKQGFGLANEYWLYLCYYLLRTGQAKRDTDFTYYHLMAKGIWTADFFAEAAFVCKLPAKVIRNRNLKLHSIAEAAIQWRNGSGLYFIDGVRIENQLWQQIINRKLSCKEILKLRNIEQRRVALMVYDPGKLIVELKGKLIDQSKRGNKLYAIKNVIRKKTIKLLVYKDPSTNRIYVSFVPDHHESADSAMAWKFYLTDQDYSNLTEEA